MKQITRISNISDTLLYKLFNVNNDSKSNYYYNNENNVEAYFKVSYLSLKRKF